MTRLRGSTEFYRMKASRAQRKAALTVSSSTLAANGSASLTRNIVVDRTILTFYLVRL